MVPVDIGHPEYMGLIDPDAAFWSLVKKELLADALVSGGAFMKQYVRRRERLMTEMRSLRFGLTPSAVYFNPTDRCNLNCSYCYIPENLRQRGKTMTPERLIEALEILKRYFGKKLPKGARPQIVFHGAEPMLAREAVFAGIEAFAQTALKSVFRSHRCGQPRDQHHPRESAIEMQISIAIRSAP